jgi:hypothetical protein
MVTLAKNWAGDKVRNVAQDMIMNTSVMTDANGKVQTIRDLLPVTQDPNGRNVIDFPTMVRSGIDQVMDITVSQGPGGEIKTIGDFFPVTEINGQPAIDFDKAGSDVMLNTVVEQVMTDPQKSGAIVEQLFKNNPEQLQRAVDSKILNYDENGQPLADFSKLGSMVLDAAEMQEKFQNQAGSGILGAFLNASPAQQLMLMGGVLSLVLGLGSMVGGNMGLGVAGLGAGAGLLLGGLGGFKGLQNFQNLFQGGGDQPLMPPPPGFEPRTTGDGQTWYVEMLPSAATNNNVRVISPSTGQEFFLNTVTNQMTPVPPQTTTAQQ